MRTKQRARGGLTMLCGCWHTVHLPHLQRSYMPLVKLKSHTTILSTTSSTILTQTFVNTSAEDVKQLNYSFPLYDGVSVVAFTATVGDLKIVGVVKEKQQARQDYQAAVDRGETAGLLEQLPAASDVFTTKIGNVPAGEKVIVEIVYLGELKHDAEKDGIRFTIPTVVAPRYGPNPFEHSEIDTSNLTEGIDIVVDVNVDKGSHIRQLQSPSHPVSVTIGRTSLMTEDVFDSHRASATLALNETVLEKDFVILVLAKDIDIPRALLETHPSLPNQRALMTTLVPKFKLPTSHPEVVFVVDRSGSMQGKMETVTRAMNVMLKSLPIGVKFNICSFGNHHSFLWQRSKSYDKSSLDEALKHLTSMGADFGGTEIHAPIKATVENRYKEMQLDVIVLSDGEIWNQQQLFDYINKAARDGSVRFFSLGIGTGASTALIEGIATAGDGISQFVTDNERMEKKMLRLLKGALTPHIHDYSLEVKYEKDDQEFEMVEVVKEAMKLNIVEPQKPKEKKPQATISLFDNSNNKDEEDKVTSQRPQDKFAHLPEVPSPSHLQAPHRVPSLYPFNRTVVYLLLGPETSCQSPKSVVLRGTSEHGPLELEIPVQDIGEGQTIHQLAAKKAVHELEKGRGWLIDAENREGVLIKSLYDGRWEEIVEREAVRLGVKFQVGGKFCSFVAVQNGEETEPVDMASNVESPPSPSRDRRGFACKAPRKQLASKAARKSAPTPSPILQQHQQQQQDAPASILPISAHNSMAAPGGPLFGAPSQSSCFTSAITTPTQQPSITRMSMTDPSFAARRAAQVTSSAFGAVASTAREHRKKKRSQPLADMDIDDGEDDEMAMEEEAFLPAKTDEDRMHELIGLQNFDGSWEWSKDLQVALAIDSNHEYTAPNAVQATPLVIAFLEIIVPDEKDAWELVVEKAKGWLGQQAGGEEEAEKEINHAKSLLERLRKSK